MSGSVSALKRARKSVAARNESDDELLAVIKSARLSVDDDGFIRRMPEEYQTLISEAYSLYDAVEDYSDHRQPPEVREEVKSLMKRLNMTLDEICKTLRSEPDRNIHLAVERELENLQIQIELSGLDEI